MEAKVRRILFVLVLLALLKIIGLIFDPEAYKKPFQAPSIFDNENLDLNSLKRPID
jgi:hypothetical protein